MKNTSNKYTPIKDRFTKEPILLGDLVENEKFQCGILIWDDYYNKYLIRSESGGNLHSHTYKKIDRVFKNKIDATKTECRKFANKKKW